MNIFKNLSITSQIVNLSLVLLILLGIVSFFSFKESESLIQKSNAALLGNMFLDVQNNEAKFFTARDLKYADSVKILVNKTLSLLDTFGKNELKEKLSTSIKSHYSYFKQGVETTKLRGLDENQGAEGDLRNSVHKIEEIVKEANNKSIMVEMLMARRSEKDFFMRKKEKYVDKVKAAVANIKENTTRASLSLNQKEEINLLADHYLEKFILASNLIKKQSFTLNNIENSASEIGPLLHILITEYTAKASTSQNIKLYVIILSVIVGIVLSIIVSRLITNPIIVLQNMAKEISSGNYNISIEIEHDNEIGKLTRYFNEMSQKIKTSQQHLLEEKKLVELKIEKAVEESQKQNSYLSNSVEKILAVMEKFSEGDLTVYLKSTQTDKIGELFNGFNNSVQQINNILLNVKKSVKTTVDSGKNILNNSENISEAILQQSEKINELAQAIDQITLTINDTTRNTISASETAKKAGRLAESGGSSVKETLSGMNKVAEIVNSASIKIKELGKSGEEISEIIEVINNIADQTNLLALNAAIEAARAGEQGRGFGVVADEVRKLAEQTAKATKEISGMIKKIQRDTKEAVIEIESGTAEVNKGLLLAENSGNTLSEIINATLEVEGIIHNVAAAAEEQAQASEQIRFNINMIRDAAITSSAGISEILEGSLELNNSMQNLTGSISKFKLIENDKAILQKPKKMLQLSNN